MDEVKIATLNASTNTDIQKLVEVTSDGAEAEVHIGKPHENVS